MRTDEQHAPSVRGRANGRGRRRMSDQPTFGGKAHLEYVPGQLVMRIKDDAVRPHLDAAAPGGGGGVGGGSLPRGGRRRAGSREQGRATHPGTASGGCARSTGTGRTAPTPAT